MKIKFLTAVFALFTLLNSNVFAQNVKIGYTNIEFIFQNLPAAKEIQTKLETEKGQYDKMYQSKVQDFQQKVQDYQSSAATLTDVIRADKEKSLQNLQSEIQEFQQNSENALSKKQQELMAPVMTKIQEAIDAVAKEKGYTYVLNSDAGYGTQPVVLVAPESDNITTAILAKLGVTLPAAGN